MGFITISKRIFLCCFQEYDKMNEQDKIYYDRIAEAITYIRQNFKNQPSLDEIAEKAHISPFHFQRLFTNWVGVSPKKFLQYTSVEYAKKVLKNQKTTLFDATYMTGISSTGRLHDLFVKIEGMTPGEYKNEGQSLSINYSFVETQFGKILVASTPKGVCNMTFCDDEKEAFAQLQQQFSRANFIPVVDSIQENALCIFTKDWSTLDQIKLYLKGTDFQLKVWNTLLKIPQGGLSSYGNIAKHIDNPNASRAVGTAIGKNPAAFLIPCHRVIQATGDLGDYRWGEIRKSIIIGWEASKINHN